MKSREVVWHTVDVISTLYLHRKHMAPIYGRMIILLRIFKKYQSKKQWNCENEIIISYLHWFTPLHFFSIEKEEYSFHMGLKTEWTEFECFISNVLLRHYINELSIEIIWMKLSKHTERIIQYLQEKKVFFLWLWLFR